MEQTISNETRDYIREFINDADQRGLSYAERDTALREVAGLGKNSWEIVENDDFRQGN